MGLFSKIIFGAARKTGANKNDAKIAEIEYKKQKLASKEAKQARKENKKKSKEQLMIDNAIASITYSHSKFPEIRAHLTDLEDEANRLASTIEELKQRKLSREEKRELSDAKKTLGENLPYLYLSKDYFSYTLKIASGMKLKPNEYIFLAKFVHYFDGVRVLDDWDDVDTSLLGDIKEMGQDLFGIKSKEFDFDTFVYRYDEEIDNYKVPDLKPVLDSFSNLDINKLTNDEEEEESEEEEPSNNQELPIESPSCPNCGMAISTDSKFCPNCGSKIEIAPKKKFCSQCGCQLDAGARFCPQCGHKTE